MEILRTEGLTKVFNKKNVVVDHINMTINKGDIYGFIGKNGAGKTTLIRMILTLANPTEGSIKLFGSDNLLESSKRVGSLIETPALNKGISALETIKRYSILYGADVTKAEDILKEVGLDNTGNKKVGQFSLGMKQRLGIGIALINEPELLVLDEPLNGLDPMGMKEIRDLIIRLNKEKGITFLISSHLLEELEKTATRIGIINAGKLVEESTMEDIVANCVQKIVFTVDDTEKALKIIEKIDDKLSKTSEINDKKIFVSCDSELSGTINRELVNGGVTVFLVEKAGYNLEDYFLEKVGEK